MTVEAEVRPGRHAAKPPGGSQGTLMRRTGDWARRAPLMPALVFMIIVTQLPFVVTVIVSFMDWNAYYPDERGFAGVDNFRRVLTDANTRSAVTTTRVGSRPTAVVGVRFLSRSKRRTDSASLWVAQSAPAP